LNRREFGAHHRSMPAHERGDHHTHQKITR
jgi:hypothetical protein